VLLIHFWCHLSLLTLLLLLLLLSSSSSSLLLWRIKCELIYNNSEIITGFIVYCSLEITNSTQQSTSWEANSSRANHEVSCSLWKPKFHYCVHMRLSLVSVLSQINPVHAPKIYFFKIHFHIILLQTLRFPKLSLSLRFPHQNCAYISCLTHTCHIPSPSNSFY
jgi:hypothetical protein